MTLRKSSPAKPSTAPKIPRPALLTRQSIRPACSSTQATKASTSSWRRTSTARRGLTGAQAARVMLDGAGVQGVSIVPAQGTLTDHYNPLDKTLNLSEGVYGSPSIAAVGVACHEAGHALQHAAGYRPLWLRSALVPTANIGSKVGYFTMMAGLALAYMTRGSAGPG